MSHTQEQRDASYKTSSEAIQNLYSSGEVGDAIRHTFDALTLTDGTYADYVNIFGDAFIGLETPESVHSNLMLRYNLSPGVASGIIKSVSAVIDPSIFVIPAPGTTTNAPLTPSAPVSAAPSIPASRVMPKNETELPGSLLQNLKASLAHDAAGAAYVEEDTPKPSYGAILDTEAGK